MNFADKFQILNQIPTGEVDTYVAKDLETGERVLLHVFETHDRSEAPAEPLGGGGDVSNPILNEPPNFRNVSRTGQEQPKKYTYSVTDSSSLQTWKKPASQPKDDGLSQERAFAATSSEAVPANSPPNPALNATAIHTAVLSSSDGQPGEFTKQFFALPDQGLRSSKSKPDEFFEKLSGPSEGATLRERPSSSLPEQEETQGFTSFFQGPFHGGVSLDTPALTQNLPARRSQTDPGEFTKLFGRQDMSGADPRTVQDFPRSDRDSGAFVAPKFELSSNRPLTDTESTPFYQGFEPVRRKSDDPFIQSARVEAGSSAPGYSPEASPEFSSDYGDSGSSLRNHAPQEPKSFESNFGPGKRTAMATEIFAAPRRDLSQSSPPVLTGPSEYTQIIFGNRATAEDPEGTVGSEAPDAQTAPAANPLGLPTFKAPAQPAAPATPKLPKPPEMKAPSARAGKKLSAVPGAPKQMSPSALPIIVLTFVFLLVSLAMALYFLLKH